MKLEPLKQWVCDACGGVIENAEDGWVEWLKTDRAGAYGVTGFRITHHLTASPSRHHRFGSCYAYEHRDDRQDTHLHSFLGDPGFAYMLGMYKQAAGDDSWLETFRRLYVPYYEEARLYWPLAEADGVFYDANETGPYRADSLRRMVEKYRDRDLSS